MPGAHLWSLQFGGEKSSDIAWGQATAIDPFGDVVVVARVTGTVDFGDGPKISNPGIVLAKYSADGQILWSRLGSVSGVGPEIQPKSMVVNADGSAVVTGYFSGTVSFGSATLTSTGGYDLFLVKYSGTGEYQWSKCFGGTGSEVVYGMAADASGNLFLTGFVQGSTTLGGSTFSSLSGSRDIFLAKYSASGGHLWTLSFGGSSTDTGLAVAISGGDPWITGSFQGSVDFGSGLLTSAGSDDVFVAGFSGTNGLIIDSWREGGTASDQGRAIASDGAGNLVFAATFKGSASFGGTTLSSAGLTDIALVQYSSAGSLRWVRKFGGSFSDIVNSLAVNTDGYIAITGTFEGMITMGGDYLVGMGSVDPFIAKYDATGAHIWSRGSYVDWADYGYGIAIDDDGEVVATGSFYQGIDLGGGLMSTGPVSSSDGYLARFAP